MTALKALPPPNPMLTLPNYSFQSTEHFVENEFVDSFLRDLTEFVERRTAELGAQKTIDMATCKALISAAAPKSQKNIWADVLEGASLAFNPFPVRKRYVIVNDIEALQSDWTNALSDANKVWHTIELCIPKSLKSNHERPTSPSSMAPARQR